MLEPSNSFLVAILGPTGSGKSALALSICEAFGGEIVNFDSVQLYTGLNIGSAKTPPGQRRGIAHHLIDIAPPNGDLTAGAFSGLARKCLKDLADRKILPVLVGGTGLYLRSLLEGLSPAPGRDPGLRQRLTELADRRPDALHRHLRRANPDGALRIHANDHQKLIRAIELAAACSPPGFRQPLTGFDILKIGLNPPRPNLNIRINQRSAAMFEQGLLEETRQLLNSGVPADCKALQSLGYKQAVAVIDGRLTVPASVEDLQIKTRQYAKRQMTWFRRESNVHWLDGFGDTLQIQDAAFELLGGRRSKPANKLR